MIVARHEVPGVMRKIVSASLPRHFVPGYYQPVPPGQKPFTHRSASQQVSAYRSTSLPVDARAIQVNHSHIAPVGRFEHLSFDV